MKVLIVVGARPNFVKAAPILAELERRRIETVLVHTGQHYDAALSGVFFAELGIREPDHKLGVGSGDYRDQVYAVATRFAPVLRLERPDWVVVLGDVNSSLAATLTAVQIERRPRIAHVEAGLRSHDWAMPEEGNRVMVDRLSDLLLTPTRCACTTLQSEGIEASRIRFVGNVMIDTMLAHLPRANGRIRRGHVVVTVHRPSNAGVLFRLNNIIKAVAAIAAHHDVLWPVHPRLAHALRALDVPDAVASTMCEPLGYLDMLSAVSGARCVLTDSGGLQEETTVLGVPCVTLRENTERPITVTHGTNRLAPWPLTAEGIMAAFDEAVAAGPCAVGEKAPELWDGKTAGRIVDAIMEA